MSRRRAKARPLRFEELLAWWQGQARSHLCRRLHRGLDRGAYEIVVVRSRTAWKCVILPNVHPTPRAWDERCRYCPYCGTRVVVVQAPPKPPDKHAAKVVVPDHLPPEVGA